MNVGARIIESYFITVNTYNNLLTLIRDFLGYIESILSISPDEEWIPALHFNQSSIEGFFTCIRAMIKDRTDLYAGGIQQQHMFQNLQHSKKSR